jgi:hypothetical protein
LGLPHDFGNPKALLGGEGCAHLEKIWSLSMRIIPYMKWKIKKYV